MATKKIQTAWMIQAEQEFGTRTIRAYVVIPQDNGELHLPQTGFNQPLSALADLRVSAYLGDIDFSANRSINGRVWGMTVSYKPFSIDSADRAREIARTLGRIERAERKANTEHGYLPDHEFAGRLARIGAAIGVTKYYTRRFRTAYDRTGELFRKELTISDVQSWVSTASEYAESKPHELSIVVR